MKQHITKEQLSELSLKAQDRLYDWYKSKSVIPGGNPDYPVCDANKSDHFVFYRKAGSNSSYILRIPLLTIGQMIEFLEDHRETWSWSLHSFYEGQYGTQEEGTPDYRKRKWLWTVERWTSNGVINKDYDGELCDALWNAVKEELEK